MRLWTALVFLWLWKYEAMECDGVESKPKPRFARFVQLHLSPRLEPKRSSISCHEICQKREHSRKAIETSKGLWFVKVYIREPEGFLSFPSAKIDWCDDFSFRKSPTLPTGYKGSTRRWLCSKPLVVIAALEGTRLILKTWTITIGNHSAENKDKSWQEYSFLHTPCTFNPSAAFFYFFLVHAQSHRMQLNCSISGSGSGPCDDKFESRCMERIWFDSELAAVSVWKTRVIESTFQCYDWWNMGHFDSIVWQTSQSNKYPEYIAGCQWQSHFLRSLLLRLAKSLHVSTASTAWISTTHKLQDLWICIVHRRDVFFAFGWMRLAVFFGFFLRDVSWCILMSVSLVGLVSSEVTRLHPRRADSWKPQSPRDRM